MVITRYNRRMPWGSRLVGREGEAKTTRAAIRRRCSLTIPLIESYTRSLPAHQEFESTPRMANHKSAEKRFRQTVTRTEINRARVSRIRTFLKKVEVALEAGNREEARQAFIEVQPELQRGVSKGVMHKNTVARKLSRLNARIAAL